LAEEISTISSFTCVEKGMLARQFSGLHFRPKARWIGPANKHF
jgi:hypothetical protein